MDDVATGTVGSFDPDLGMGVIIGTDGTEWPFHCTTIADGTRAIAVDAAVSFRIGPGGPGRWEAFAVTAS